jgi:uncharacterized membrane protein
MEKTGKCEITGKELPLRYLVRIESIRPQILEMIRKAYPGWTGDKGMISIDLLNDFRNEYVQQMLTEENGELSMLDIAVMESIRNKDLLSSKLDADPGEKPTPGQKIADKVALFGGSWNFIILFAIVLFLWISINSFLLLSKPFDPYPFILMNLILSCLAAIQAPVIMMSQNRQEATDRARAQNDYQVNLKAEIEIRQLHEKIDHILINQAKRLFEIQEIQIDLMEQIMKTK